MVKHREGGSVGLQFFFETELRTIELLQKVMAMKINHQIQKSNSSGGKGRGSDSTFGLMCGDQ